MNLSLANISDLSNNGSLITFTNSSFDLSVCGNLSPDYIRVGKNFNFIYLHITESKYLRNFKKKVMNFSLSYPAHSQRDI